MMSIATVVKGAHVQVVTVQATDDSDTTAIIQHTLGEVPKLVSLVPLDAAFYTSQWCLATVDASKIVLTKKPAAGSGAFRPQVRVNIERPHSQVA